MRHCHTADLEQFNDREWTAIEDIVAESLRSPAVERALTRAIIALCSWSLVQARIRWDPSLVRHGRTKRRRCQPKVTAWRGGVCEPESVVEVRSGEGFHVNSS